MIVKAFLLVLAVFFLASWNVAMADVVTLKSGKVLEGEIVRVSDSGLAIRTQNGEESFMFSFIETVSPSTSKSVPNTEYLDQLALQFGSGEQRVQFFMASWCPYCRKMEEFLISSRIPYEKLDVDQDSSAQERLSKLGGNGIPVLVINDQVIHGYDPEAVQAAWDNWKKGS